MPRLLRAYDQAPASSLVIPILYRDFRYNNTTNGSPDFENYNNGLATGLVPSLMLGTGTFGGTSTTDSVTYRHLLNVKRVAYARGERLIAFCRFEV